MKSDWNPEKNEILKARPRRIQTRKNTRINLSHGCFSGIMCGRFHM